MLPALPRRTFLTTCAAAVLAAGGPPAIAAAEERAQTVLRDWYRLILELVRHTATYSPPVAARSFAYLGVTAFEALASGRPELRSLAGQLPGLASLPGRNGAPCDEALVLHAAMSHALRAHFGNTGPTGLRAMDAMDRRLDALTETGPDAGIVAASRAYGTVLSAAILAWSAQDGGAQIDNMGFPDEYALGKGPSHWVPTSAIALQQHPLLPRWGENRGFVLSATGLCGLPEPLPYAEAPGTPFRAQAEEVYRISRTLTDEQKLIARFWSDDPMLSPTPPGHWVSIALQIFDRDGTPMDRRVEVLALLGMAISDAFVMCWRAKYHHDLLRPVTYIRRLIDPAWEPLLNTPPFPEYPSGHATQSGAAAEVLEALFGANLAFTDSTHEDDGLAPRSFAGFRQAAQEAALSRLYGGIHFRSANEGGLTQGACVGRKIMALKTRPTA